MQSLICICSIIILKPESWRFYDKTFKVSQDEPIKSIICVKQTDLIWCFYSVFIKILLKLWKKFGSAIL